ncbi:MAG: NAD/NADP octopine/nopaline dehydrogenase family protein [Lentilitoribacter sp.]
MNIGIAGAGAIAKGYAAYLLSKGHSTSLWSPSGKSTKKLMNGAQLEVTGAIEGKFNPKICNTIEELAKHDVIILALPANGYRTVFDAIIPHLKPRHCIIISGHLSLAALYLSKKLSQRGIQIPISAWNTTALTAKTPKSINNVHIGMIRPHIQMATIPMNIADRATAICKELFGNIFETDNDLLSITLSNLNPEVHLAVALCNLTRIERGEDWLQNPNITPLVSNLIAALDDERIKIANAFGYEITDIKTTMETSLSMKEKSLAELYQQRAFKLKGPLGPKDISTRYVLEDMPFGLSPLIHLAKSAGVDVPVHMSGMAIMNACYDREFEKDNNLISDLHELDLDQLKNLSLNGF